MFIGTILGIVFGVMIFICWISGIVIIRFSLFD